ncbi:MAG TPA: BatD family protein [Thermoanaerobaculia bacterium]|nr:BatD family protein [Thermoanaerobaculia bacterium]
MKNSKVVVGFLFFIFYFSFEIRNSFANEISVDKRTMQMDDSITITVTLENAFANVDSIRIPLQNLALSGAPSVSSEFQWINGVSSRRKIFTYTAHATAPGNAVVGPITLHGTGGQVETLAPISIQIVAAAAAGSNDPLKILRELMATNRDAICLVAEADKSAAFTGEEIVVTWTLYNATAVQQYAIGEIPKLEDFWTEELDVRGEPQQQITLENLLVQKLAIRRVALFPLHSGSLFVPSLGVNASILKRVGTRGPFNFYEGMEVDIHRRSAPLTIRVRPIPPGPAVAVIGDSVTMRCSVPVQRNGGPVAIDVTLNGRANLRAVAPPAFERPPAGSVQIIDKKLDVHRVRYDAWMSRQWQYLVFPARDGEFTAPALTAAVLSSDGERKQLRCDATTLIVRAAAPGEPPPRLAVRKPPVTRPALVLWLVAVVLTCTLIALAVARTQRSQRIRSTVRRMVRPTAPETRMAVDEYLHSRGIEPGALLREASDRGDAYRSLRSLLDALERERVVAGEGEIFERVRDLVTA